MDAQVSQVEESPQQFPALQFSPEGLGFQTSGPATAPVYPQNKLFWDPEQTGDITHLDFPMDDAFAAFGMQKNLDPFSLSHESSTFQFPTSPAFNLVSRADDAPPFTSSEVDASTRTTAPTKMTRKASRGNGVDPSLLFSSPGRNAEASSMPSTSQEIQDDNLLPYAHQLRDAQMELEMQMARKSKRKRGAETDSPAVQAALQTLRDDHAGVVRDLADDISSTSSTKRPSSRTSARSRENPLNEHRTLHKQRSKSRLQLYQSEVPPHRRTSVTLTIDATGRAKTEAKVLANSGKSTSQIEVDSDEESDSNSSSSEDKMVTSQNPSFASFPRRKEKLPKLGHFTHNASSHSHKSSYASTTGTNNTFRTASESFSRRPSSSLINRSSAQQRHPRVSFHQQDKDEEESEAGTIVESDNDKGDAQSALKKVIQSHRKEGSARSTGSVSRNPYLPQPGPPHPYYAADSLTPARNAYNPYANTSPTTITDPDLATPSSRRSNLSSDSIRCLCHTSDDDGQLMIQW